MSWFLRSATQEEKSRFEHWHFLVRTIYEAARTLGVRTVSPPPFFEARLQSETFDLEDVLRFEHPRLVFEAYEKVMTEQLDLIERSRSQWNDSSKLERALDLVRDEFAKLPEAVYLKAPFRTFFHLLPAFRGSAMGSIPLFVYHPLRVTDDAATLAIPSAFPEFFENALQGFLARLDHPFQMKRSPATHFLRLEVQA